MSDDKDKKFKTILVVEDDPGIQFVLRTAINEAGYVCFVASSKQEAVDKLSVLEKVEKPCLILTDLTMPGDGYELIRFLNGSNALAVIPVVVVSGNRPDDRTKLYKYIPKPFKMDNILKVIEEHCGEPSCEDKS